MLSVHSFITILPMPPYTEPTNSSIQAYHYWPDKLDRVVATVWAKYVAIIDVNRIHCVGYSMGGRGCWRWSETHPTVSGLVMLSALYTLVIETIACTSHQPLASTISVAAGAESTGDKYLVLEPAPATFPLLGRIKNLWVHHVAGTQDTTAGVVGNQRTQAELVRLGSKRASLSIVQGADHTTLQSVAFTSNLLQWVLNRKRDPSLSCVPSPAGVSIILPSSTVTGSSGLVAQA